MRLGRSILLLWLLTACGGDAGVDLDDTAVALVAVLPIRVVLEFPGETETMQVQARNAAREPVSATIEWSTDDPSVATVDTTGTVTAVAPGTTRITASVGDVSDGADVEVTGPASFTIMPGEWQRLIDGDPVGSAVFEEFQGGIFRGSHSDGETQTVISHMRLSASGDSAIYARADRKWQRLELYRGPVGPDGWELVNFRGDRRIVFVVENRNAVRLTLQDLVDAEWITVEIEELVR